MNEDYKTIKELAEELGVSKQRIQQIIAKLSPNKMPSKKGNKYILNLEDIYNIKVSMGLENDKSTKKETTNRVVDYDIYLDVINSLKEKDEQIKSLVETQKQTQNLLDQQQRLALQDKKLLEEYKAENDNLKALNMTAEGRQAGNQPQEELERLKSENKDLQEQLNEQIPEEPKKAPRKWWQIWKI